ncbi:MAG: hypothetical protein ACI4JB_00285 [Porcipelethomonas sp.]
MFNNIQKVLRILGYINIGVYTIAGFIFGIGMDDDVFFLWLLTAAAGFFLGYMMSLVLFAIAQHLEDLGYINENLYIITSLYEKDHEKLSKFLDKALEEKQQ